MTDRARVSPTFKEMDVSLKLTDVAEITTETSHLAEAFPHFAKISVLPVLTPITIPSLTVAISGLVLTHVTVLFEALDGVNVTFKTSFAPFSRLIEVLFKLMAVTSPPPDGFSFP